MNNDVRIVFISIPREQARSFARELVEQRLVACVNSIPQMDSFYWWDEKVLTDHEALLIVKTTEQKFGALQEYVVENHPYEIPELLAVPVTEGLDDYMAWVRVETERD